ncbi:MAG: Ribokinase [Candidatus Saccharicenans subterraneus]|uniref:Ribokinase n=1 Tax=Candidatus Saccharicenans subterraneus TaxID=2508984 RepID=A0A3E2BME1_9BACT|nr:MAG: Ribokinase [Candidatus Saccharicenans subterraneum]
MSLVIVGSVAFDTIETPYGRRDRIIGGSGTYAALAASFFTRPGLVSVVGRDFPRRFLDRLRSRKIDLAGLRIKQGKTFYWHGRYDQDPNLRTTIKTELNVLQDFKPVLPESFRKADLVFLSNLDPESHDFILQQLTGPRLVAMDTIRYWIENKPEALLRAIQKVDILFVNDEECRLIARELNLVRAGRKLLAAGPGVIVVKKGEHGAMLFGKNFVFGVVANPCERVVDPTGAGDAFAGAFLGYLDSTGRFNQRELRKAAVYGNVVASLVIEDFGVDGLLRASQLDIINRYQQFRKLCAF